MSEFADVVKAVDVPVDGESLACALGAIDHFTAKVSEALAEFDRLGLWELDAATSLTAWLRDRAGQTRREAAITSRTAKRLRSMRVTRQAWLDGALTGGQAQSIVANVSPATKAIFAEHEPELVSALSGLPMHETATAMRSWAAHAEAIVEPGTQPDEPRRSLRLARTLDGRGEMAGSLDAEGTALVEAALRLVMANDTTSGKGNQGEGDGDAGGERRRSAAERRGDALVDVCRHFLDHRSGTAPKRHRPHLNVVVRLDDLLARGQGTLDGTTPVDATTIQRLACDADVHRLVVTGRSAILDYGRRTRVVSADLWNTLVLRDRRCRWPGCDRPPEWTEAHHVTPWARGGRTALGNLVLACSRHHHIAHQPGWHLELDPGGALHVTNPAGYTRTTRPPGW